MNILDKYGDYVVRVSRKYDNGEIFYLGDERIFTLEELYQSFKERYDRERDETER
jgi:hypothetical protein